MITHTCAENSGVVPTTTESAAKVDVLATLPAPRRHRRNEGNDTAEAAVAVGRPRWRITLMGSFGLTVNDLPVTVPASTQRLLALLALRGRCGRSRLAGSLWPDTTELRALARLRTAVWRAHQSVDGLLVSRHDTIDLEPNAAVDVAQLVRTAHDVMKGRTTVDPAGYGMSYVEGALLPDWNDDWLVVDRERLRQLRLHVLEALAGQLAGQGMYGMALDAALAALRSDELRESAHRAVIRIHLAEGNVSEAMQAYDSCRAVLAREMGLEPSSETVRLVQELRSAAYERASRRIVGQPAFLDAAAMVRLARSRDSDPSRGH